MIIGLSVLAQAQTMDSSEFANLPKDVSIEDARSAIRKKDFNQAVFLYKAVLVQEQKKKTVSGDLLGEYAIALALCHNFDYALTNLDRARQLKGENVDYYTAQVLWLMRMENLAKKFSNDKKILLDYAIPIRQRDTLERKTLNTAYELAQKKQYVRALVILSLLEEDYPDAFVIPIISSQIWEAMDKVDQALESLKRGIRLMERDGRAKDIQTYKNHLVKLEEKNRKIKNSSSGGALMYAGASFAKGRYSLDSRMGLYAIGSYNSRVNMSLNMSVMNYNEITTGSIGLTSYMTFGKIFILGGGLNYILMEDSKPLSGSVSLGLTFPNKTKTSSVDIMWNAHFNTDFKILGSDSKYFNITIGQTFYF